MKALKAESLLLTVTVIWGATFLFTKLGLRDVPPFLYMILRFTIAISIGSLLWFKHLKSLEKSVLMRGLVLGFFFGGGFLLQTFGLNHTSVAKAAFITGLSVPLTPFAFMLVQRKKVQFWQKIGVIIATIGLWLFTDPDLQSVNIGDLAIIISTLFWAFYITYMDVFTKGIKNRSVTFQLVMIQFAMCWILSAASFAIFELKNYTINFTMNLGVSLGFNAIVASLLLTFIHTSVQRFTTPVKAALIFSLEPVFASLFAFLALNEFLSGREYFGALILLCGVLASETGEYATAKLSILFHKIF